MTFRELDYSDISEHWILRLLQQYLTTVINSIMNNKMVIYYKQLYQRELANNLFMAGPRGANID